MTLAMEREILGSDMAAINSTPNANRIHIGVFGRTNSGKSTFVNSFTGHQVSIVSEVSGTTTDPVYKAMEINPLGPCVIIDTAGLEDNTQLGNKRLEKTMLAMDKADIAVVLLPVKEDCDEDYEAELSLLKSFAGKKLPILCVVNRIGSVSQKRIELVINQLKRFNAIDHFRLLVIDCSQPKETEQAREMLAQLVPEDFEQSYITGDLVAAEDLVLLVMPQDIQAPKNRLILPQVQTIRELLDRKCTVVSTTTDKFLVTLGYLSKPPKLIITDSQVFGFVYDNKPAESKLTSFSVLFAAYKGDLACYVEGAKYIDKLSGSSKVLIAECCTHAPLAEDIGRVKIPRMLRKRFGEEIKIEVVSGTDFPEDPSGYDLIIQCGGCMFNRHYVLSRINRAKAKNVPITNYGVTIAHFTGILDKICMTS